MESTMSSPVTISSGVSLLSDTCTEPEQLRLDNAQSEDKCVSIACELNGSAPVMEEHRTDTQIILDSLSVVDMGHSDIDLRVNNTVFKTHKHLLSNFIRLEEMIQNIESRDSLGSTSSITLYRDERGVEDISNTFKILYASVINGPFSFEPPVLISALRIATVYDYPDLRAYSIKHLEAASLDAIQRIQLAREFNLSSWEGPAYAELYKRDEAITDEEAEILGVIAFAKVARAREAEKLKLGKEIGEREYKEKIKEQEEKTRKEEAKQKKEAEEKAKKEAEEKAKKEAEEKARREREEKARKEAEEKVRREKEEKGRREAEERAKKEAEERARKAAEERARREAAERVREAEERARREADNISGFRELEAKARAAEEKAKKKAEERARRAPEERFKKTTSLLLPGWPQAGDY